MAQNDARGFQDESGNLNASALSSFPLRKAIARKEGERLIIKPIQVKSLMVVLEALTQSTRIFRPLRPSLSSQCLRRLLSRGHAITE